MKSIEIGKLGRPHGVRGEIRLFFYNPDSDTLADGMEVTLQPQRGPAATVKIERIRYTPKFGILKLEGFNYRDEIERFTNAELLIDAELLPELDDDEFYLVDLIGLPVFVADEEDGDIEPEESEPIGEVKEVFETGANEVIVVTLDDGEELLVPFVEHAVSVVDLERAALILQPLHIWSLREE